ALRGALRGVRGAHTLDRSLPVWVGAALALVFLMALPLGWLAWVSVSSESGGATLDHYRAVLGDPALLKALWNTVVLAFWVGLASIAVGAPLAWLTARTDLPAKGALRALVMASFVTPPFLGAFAWVMLAGPNAGLLNTLWRSWVGTAGPLVNIFTMPGLVFVVTIYTFPYVYIMIANTLALIASDLEEAAAIHGAGRLTVALTVTLPMLLLVQKRVLGRRGYAAVGGKGGQRRAIPLGVWKWPALAACLLVMACAIFLPYGMLAKAAFSRAWAQPLTWSNTTLANFTFTFFEYGATRAAIVNTLELGLLTASVGAVLVALLAYVSNRRLVVGHQIVSFLALAPIVIPGVVLAVALFLAYPRPPFVLYGTLAILFVAYLTKEMPTGYAQSDATFRGIPPDLEDAGRILGAGRLRILRDVTAPLARSGIIAAWCFIFIGVIRELSAS